MVQFCFSQTRLTPVQTNFLIRFSTLELDLAYFLKKRRFSQGQQRIKLFLGNSCQFLNNVPPILLNISILGLIGHLASDGMAHQTNTMALVRCRDQLLGTYTKQEVTPENFIATVTFIFQQFCQIFSTSLGRVEKTDTAKQCRLVMYYIDMNLYQKLTPTLITRALGLDKAYTAALFKKETGMSISAYLQQAKLREARRLLLNTDISISQIAVKLNYYDIAEFTRRFTKAFQMAPSIYREMNRIVGPSTY